MCPGDIERPRNNVLLLCLLGQEGQMQLFALTGVTHARLVQHLHLIQHVTQMGDVFLAIIVGDDTIALKTVYTSETHTTSEKCNAICEFIA
jgi:hypothetical protein